MAPVVNLVPSAREAEQLAQLFHETYERLAPDYGYRTREASAKPWSEVPENNRALMIATCAQVLAAAPGLDTTRLATALVRLSRFTEGAMSSSGRGDLSFNDLRFAETVLGKSTPGQYGAEDDPWPADTDAHLAALRLAMTPECPTCGWGAGVYPGDRCQAPEFHAPYREAHAAPSAEEQS